MRGETNHARRARKCSDTLADSGRSSPVAVKVARTFGYSVAFRCAEQNSVENAHRSSFVVANESSLRLCLYHFYYRVDVYQRGSGEKNLSQKSLGSLGEVHICSLMSSARPCCNKSRAGCGSTHTRANHKSQKLVFEIVCLDPLTCQTLGTGIDVLSCDCVLLFPNKWSEKAR